MNIGFFTDTYFPQINGVVTSIETFRRELVKLGHKVYIFGPRIGTGSSEEILRDQETNVFRYFSMPYPMQDEHRIVFPYCSKQKSFKRFNLDIIHTHSFFPLGIYGTFLGLGHKIPVVHTYHTLWSEYLHYSFLPRKLTRRLVDQWSRIYCNKCDLIISPSEAIKEVLPSYGVRTPIEVIPTGLEWDLLHRKKGEDIRKLYGIPEGVKILSFVGRLGIEKNIYFLLHTFKQILRKAPDTRLILVGDGPEKAHLEEFVRNHGLDNNVIFAGYLKRPLVINVLAQSDLFVFASKTETQGLALVEALAAGTPAVVVEAMGVGEILAGDVGGFLSGENEEEFAGKVIKILGDKAIYKQKAEEALELSHEYSAENMTLKLNRKYEELLSR